MHTYPGEAQFDHNEVEEYITRDEIEKTTQKKTSILLRVAPVVLTIILAISGLFGWFSSMDNDIKAYADTRVKEMQTEVEKDNDVKFAKKSDVSRIEESIKHQEKDIQDIKTEQRELSKKMDRVIEHLIK